jgi:hypothetical protein
MEFVEITADGASGAGAAPYLDYAPLPSEHGGVVREHIGAEAWLSGSGVEARALAHAIERLAPAHLSEVKERTLARVAKTRGEVYARLHHEITYWDGRAVQLSLEEEAGKPTRLPAHVARTRADELSRRLESRLRELDLEAQIDALPPVVVGGAIVVPQGLLDRLTGVVAPREPELFARETARVERLAMAAVMAAERAAGHQPRDVSADKLGYDVESRSTDGRLRFIEVKGRTDGATTVTVTRNEIMKSFAVPNAWYLAIVAVDGEVAADPVYLRRPFRLQPEEAATSVNYAIAQLMSQGERVELAA